MKNNKLTGDDFVNLHAEGMRKLGFWTEEFRSTVLRAIESRYKPEIIRAYTITDFVANGDKVLVKWNPRLNPLTDDELKANYGYNNL